MSSRHTRRKRSKAKQAEKLLALAQAERSRRIAEIVRENLSKPIERNYYPTSNMGRLASMSHRGLVTGSRTFSREGKIVRGKFVAKN